jgi:hypothetical protein
VAARQVARCFAADAFFNSAPQTEQGPGSAFLGDIKYLLLFIMDVSGTSLNLTTSSPQPAAVCCRPALRFVETSYFRFGF